MQNLQSFDKNRQFYPNWMFKYKIAPIFLYRKSVLSRYTYVYTERSKHYNQSFVVSFSSHQTLLLFCCCCFYFCFSCHVISSNHWRGNNNLTKCHIKSFIFVDGVHSIPFSRFDSLFQWMYMQEENVREFVKAECNLPYVI